MIVSVIFSIGFLLLADNPIVQMIPIASIIVLGLPLTVTVKVDQEKGVILKYRLGFPVEKITITEIVKLIGKKTSYIDSVKLNKWEEEVEYVLQLVNGESVNMGSSLYVNHKQIVLGDYLKKQYRIRYVEETTQRSTNVV